MNIESMLNRDIEHYQKDDRVYCSAIRDIITTYDEVLNHHKSHFKPDREYLIDTINTILISGEPGMNTLTIENKWKKCFLMVANKNTYDVICEGYFHLSQCGTPLKFLSKAKLIKKRNKILQLMAKKMESIKGYKFIDMDRSTQMGIMGVGA